MRRVTALLLAAVMGGLLCACQSSPAVITTPPEPSASVSPTVERRFALGYDPNGDLNPYTSDSKVNLTLNSLLYEGLYRLDEQFLPQPVLAESAQVSENGLEWTVTLREDVPFCDGTPLSAELVAASLQAAKSGTRYAARLQNVRAIHTADNSVVISLSAPNGNFLALLDIPVVLEREGLFLGTGRYRYAQEEDRLCLLANENRQGSVPYDKIQLAPVSSADERISAFNSGKITAVTADLTSAYELGYSCSYETWDYATTNLLYVGFRCGGDLFASPQVRRAFACAFDRTKLVTALLAGHGDPAELPISPYCGEFSTGAAEKLAYDPEAALGLLAEAGYERKEDGLLHQGRTPIKATLLVNGDNASKMAIAQQLAEDLSKIGVTVTINHPSWAGYLSALRAGNFDLYLGEICLTGDFDSGALMSGSLNYGWFYSQDLDGALALWKSSAGERRSDAAEALWMTFAQEVPLAPLCFRRESLLVRWGELSDLTPTQGDPFGGFGG